MLGLLSLGDPAFDPQRLLQTVFIGLSQGASYALIALGYTMVYGVLGMINFAHGEIFMLGAYAGILGLVGLSTWGFSQGHPLAAFAAALGASAAVCGAYGAALERVAYRPLRQAHPLTPLISAIGASIFLQNYVQIAQGTDNKIFPHVVRGAFEGGSAAGGALTPIQGVILLVAFACMGILHLFVTRTRWGIALRAVAQDREMASLVGIPVDRAIAGTFVLGSGLAAVAGMLVALNYGNAYPFMGYTAGLKAFTAAVLGGIGNIPGAIAGGILLGLVENIGVWNFGGDYKDAYSFLVLMAILILRPQGLLGERTAEKV